VVDAGAGARKNLYPSATTIINTTAAIAAATGVLIWLLFMDTDLLTGVKGDCTESVLPY